jgi:hypothetical protein
MKFKTNTSQGWTETIIDDHCEFSKFEKVATILSTKLDIVFGLRANDLDSCYWDFVYGGSDLCLHYNVHLGVSIFPLRFRDATEIDNDNVIKITTALMILLEDWSSV